MALDAPAKGPVTRVELLVPDLRCAGCMRRVEGLLAEQPGIVSARVNLSEKRVRADLAPAFGDARALIAVLEEAGYAARLPDAETGALSAQRAEGRDLVRRIGVAGFAAMNVMLLSVSVWSGAEGATRDLLHWISALIALPTVAYSGRPFFASAISALRGRRLNMDVPISFAILLSFVGSILETARSGEHAYFDAALMLLFFLLIGRWLETNSRAEARSAAAELARLMPHETTVLVEGTRQTLAIERLGAGMTVLLAPGDRVPADGVVAEGLSEIDRALLTGESRPEPASPGTVLHAGTLNLSGPLTMTVRATGKETVLADIARVVEAASQGRSRWDGWADRAARVYAPGVHLIALLAFIGWWSVGAGWAGSLQIACAVLIITCPCALALAVPTVHSVATAQLLRSGIYLKDGSELERLASVDTVALDKTGTLTDGRMRLVGGPAKDDPAWGVARALAEASRHPAARAVAEAAVHAPPADVRDLRETPGIGVEGRLEGATVRLGRGEGNEGTVLEPSPGRRIVLGFEEHLRPDAAETVAALHRLGLNTAVLTGDRAAAAETVAKHCGIETVHAALLPGEKLAYLENRKAEGQHVLMVGDGLNDGPALAGAHASMSPAEAADASRVAAGLVWSGRGLGAVATALRVARAARARAWESFAFAALYNAVAIPLAVGGQVTPLIAALAMSGSSVVVVANALRLRFVK
ncbi:MAG: heavy metal translocating P-type ATPase [Pseudomonadota bacterium]